MFKVFKSSLSNSIPTTTSLQPKPTSARPTVNLSSAYRKKKSQILDFFLRPNKANVSYLEDKDIEMFSWPNM